MAAAVTVDTRFTDGIPGDPLPRRPGYDSGVLTMIIASFLLVAFSFRNASRLWKILLSGSYRGAPARQSV